MTDSHSSECRITPCRTADLPTLVAVAVQSYREHSLMKPEFRNMLIMQKEPW